jgi:hypothetical protein
MRVLSNNYNISYSEIALLINWIDSKWNMIMHQILQRNTESQVVYTASNIIIIAKIKANNATIQIPVYVF